MHLTWIVDSYPSMYSVYVYVYNSGSVYRYSNSGSEASTFGKTLSLVCCCRTSSCSCMPGTSCWWTPEQKVGVEKPGNSKSVYYIVI